MARLDPINIVDPNTTDATVLGTAYGVVTLEGSSASAGQTSLGLSVGGGTVMAATGTPGIPVDRDCEIISVGVSWMSASVPSGSWTLTLYSRYEGASYASIATFSVETS